MRLSDVEGGAQILLGDGSEFKQAFVNMPVVEGSRLETRDDGRAEIEFEDGAVARLTPNSSLALNQLSRSSDGGTINQLEVLSGLVYFEAGADRSQQYSIVFGKNVITPNETSTFRVNMDANPVEVVVLQGSVQASNPGAFSVSVHEGETIRFDAGDARYFLASETAPDSWDQWNIDRDKALASLSAQQTSIDSAGVNSGAPGWSDLDHYGDWYSVPDYGNVWAPRGVDASWDPYGSGYWGYYPGTGYLWISSNPWGWLPYHCGAWNYFNGFGWGWIPNNCALDGSVWYADITIWNAPYSYIWPRRPHPVEPRDNLPHHGSPHAGTFIAVNRGPQLLDGQRRGTVSFPRNSPRTLFVGGQAIAPLPKTFNPRAGEMVDVSGAGRVVSSQPGGYQGLRPQLGAGRPPSEGGGGHQEGNGYQGANGGYQGRSGDVPLTRQPYLTSPRAPSAPQEPRQPGLYVAPPPYQQRTIAPPAPPRMIAPPAPPRASAPERSSAPESRSSAPPPAPAPAPAGKK
ncbi:MAG TPA: FecR family protein [Acidisarcina sp.]